MEMTLSLAHDRAKCDPSGFAALVHLGVLYLVGQITRLNDADLDLVSISRSALGFYFRRVVECFLAAWAPARVLSSHAWHSATPLWGGSVKPEQSFSLGNAFKLNGQQAAVMRPGAPVDGQQGR